MKTLFLITGIVAGFTIGILFADLEENDVRYLSTNVALVMGYYWGGISKHLRDRELDNLSLKYLILDIRYTPPLWIKGFKIKYVYSNLVVVYERK